MAMTRAAALQTLGLDASASAPDIKERYRQLAKQHHPDVSPEAAASETFQQITQAVERLLGEDAPAQDESLGPAIRARWNIRRRHQTSEYPAWFKPSRDGGRSQMHTLAASPFVRRPLGPPFGRAVLLRTARFALIGIPGVR